MVSLLNLKKNICIEKNEYCKWLLALVTYRDGALFEVPLWVSCSEILACWVMDLRCVVSDPTLDGGRWWWFRVKLLERSFANVRPPSSGLHFGMFLSECVSKSFQAFP